MHMNNIKRTTYNLNETLMEKSAEQNIDMVISLPDYCADIGNILQSFAFINVSSGSITGGKIKTEGTVLVRVLYLNEGEIFSFEQSEPFTKEMDYTADELGTVLDLSTFLQYLNSRAASPRKIEIHGAFVIKAKVSACRSSSVIDDVDREDIQIHKDTLSACSASGNATANISVNQVIDIGTDKPPVRSIIRNSTAAQVIETKQVSGKVLVKGELKVKTLYKSEENTVEYIENVLPLSQILDIEGMDENSTLDIRLKLASLDITVKPSALGNMSLLDISAGAVLSACAYNCIDFPVLMDAYSTEYECQCSFKDVSVDRIMTNISKNYIHQFSIENVSEPARVIDVWCDEVSAKADIKNEQPVFSGTVKCYLLYEDMEGKLNLKSANSEFSFNEDIGAVSHMKCEPNAVIVGTDYLINENRVDVRVDLHISAVILASENAKVVDDINLSETPLQKSTSFFVYYAHKGENVWSIARKYHTTTKNILEQNALEGDEITGDVPLLIWG